VQRPRPAQPPIAALCRFPGLLAATTLAALACATPATGWIRTELYLGRNLPDGGTLSTSDIESFLAREAGPRLGGWTLLDARGHWIAQDGGTVDEPTSLLVVLHPAGPDDATLEELRRSYARTYGQQSVLRVDAPAGASF